MSERFTGLVLFTEDNNILYSYDFRKNVGEWIPLNGPYLPGVFIMRLNDIKVVDTAIEYLKSVRVEIIARIEYGGYIVEKTYQETKYKGEVVRE